MNTTPANIPIRQGLAGHPSALGPLSSLQREIDRLFDDFTPSWFGRARGIDEVRCRMDVADTRDGLELTLEVPGLDEKDVEVAVTDGMLMVRGEKKFESDNSDRNYHLIERGYGAFSRSIPLPEGVKADQIKATLGKGVLKVAVPVTGKTEPKKIAVQTAH